MVLADEPKEMTTPASHPPEGVDASEYGLSKGGVPPPMPVRHADQIFLTGGDTYINVVESSPARSLSNRPLATVPAASGTT